MRVGIIGVGIMGESMARRLLAAGHTVLAYNRTESKLAPLVELGAQAAKTPGEAAATADVVITMVTDPAAVRAVTLEPGGILGALTSGSVHCEMSTISPQASAEIAEAYLEAGRMYVQAPVLGSKKQVVDGSLIVLAGGAKQAIDFGESAWSAFSSQTWRFEKPEMAATTKLACNMLIAQMILGLGQSLVFAQRGGVDPQTLLSIVQGSNLAAPMYASKGKSLIERNFTPNFFVRNMLKDIELATSSSNEAGFPLRFAELASEFFRSAALQGYGEEDYSAVVKVLEKEAGIEIGAIEASDHRDHAGSHCPQDDPL